MRLAKWLLAILDDIYTAIHGSKWLDAIVIDLLRLGLTSDVAAKIRAYARIPIKKGCTCHVADDTFFAGYQDGTIRMAIESVRAPEMTVRTSFTFKQYSVAIRHGKVKSTFYGTLGQMKAVMGPVFAGALLKAAEIMIYFARRRNIQHPAIGILKSVIGQVHRTCAATDCRWDQMSRCRFFDANIEDGCIVF